MPFCRVDFSKSSSLTKTGIPFCRTNLPNWSIPTKTQVPFCSAEFWVLRNPVEFVKINNFHRLDFWNTSLWLRILRAKQGIASIENAVPFCRLQSILHMHMCIVSPRRCLYKIQAHAVRQFQTNHCTLKTQERGYVWLVFTLEKRVACVFKMVWINVWFVSAEWLDMFGLSLQNGLDKCVAYLSKMVGRHVWFVSPTRFE